MLKASSPLVVSLVSWSDKPPDHDASVLLVARNLGNIVTGGRDGSLVIWTLSNDGKFRPELLCCGHRGVIKNLCLANSLDLREKSYFVSHSSNNELALWNWGDGTCVKFKLDSRYHHIKIESYQPSFLDARLLFCCGRYPCIVVMHAMQLTPLYTLSSTSQPDWIADLSVFTHSNLHRSHLYSKVFVGFHIVFGGDDEWLLSALLALSKCIQITRLTCIHTLLERVFCMPAGPLV
ncbi:unnamed protein product [Dibothriocephalus latus]|uniref:Uncharacterized protein n=1 Tax=Dibothriocephalus latus TaxID=60516 RepID=A0A3P7LXA4_DIBLA|nr:unnamed protein product [Dibothriocephalus latus]